MHNVFHFFFQNALYFVNFGIGRFDDQLIVYLQKQPGLQLFIPQALPDMDHRQLDDIRRRALPELASSNFQVRSSGERMARNTPIQGTAADIIKLAMVHVWQRLRDEKLQARLLLQVHDELIVEAPENEVEQVKRILKEEMEQVVSYSVPLTAEVGTGKTWLEAH